MFVPSDSVPAFNTNSEPIVGVDTQNGLSLILATMLVLPTKISPHIITI